jgi:AraC family transcriptional regulator
MSITRTSVFQSSLLHVRHVRCRPDSSGQGDLQEASGNLLALPLSGVFAKHDGPRRSVVANASHALFFRAGDLYRLSFPGSIGDDCLTFEFSPHAGQPPFAGHGLLPAGSILQRALLWRQLRSGPCDPMLVEETAVQLLGAAAGAASPARARMRPGTAARRARQVESVKEALATRPCEAWTLEDLARFASASPFHLARVFREEVGVPIHRYLTRARLAASLEPLLDTDAGLSTIALDSGFASHSHFTASFRAAFGITPAAVRREAAARSLPQLRKIVTAPLH